MPLHEPAPTTDDTCEQGADTASCASVVRVDGDEPLAPFDSDGLRLHVLATGSKGNASVLECPDGLVLVDVGVSCRQVFARMAELDLDPARVRAILVTHEHADHIAGLRVTAGKLGVPVWASAGTSTSACWPTGVVPNTLVSGEDVEVCGVRVHPFAVPHDAAEPLGFRFSRAGDVVGYCTDLGHVTDEAGEALRDARILALEANHDPAMLRSYPGYPAHLKARIGGDHGHLSNEQAADVLPELVTSATQTVIGMHISQHTNLPSLCRAALLTGRRHVEGRATQLRVVVGSQERPMSFA